MARSGVSREALFLTSKLHPRHLGYDATTRQLGGAGDLRVDYLDLFLLHYLRCWGACATQSGGTAVGQLARARGAARRREGARHRVSN